jgi:hypothetical protein
MGKTQAQYFDLVRNLQVLDGIRHIVVADTIADNAQFAAALNEIVF